MTDTTDRGRRRPPTTSTSDVEPAAERDAATSRRRGGTDGGRAPLETREAAQGPAAASRSCCRSLCDRRGRALCAQHLAGLPRRRLHLGARHRHRSSPGDPRAARRSSRRRPRLRTSSLAMIMALVLVIVVSAGLLSLGPSLDDGEGGARPATSQPTGPPTSTVDGRRRSPSITFNADANYTAPAGIVADRLQRRRRPHARRSATRSSTASCSHRRRRPEDGQGRAEARQVHDLLHRPGPRGAGHEGDAHRLVSTRSPRRLVAVSRVAVVRRWRCSSRRAAAVAAAAAQRLQGAEGRRRPRRIADRGRATSTSSPTRSRRRGHRQDRARRRRAGSTRSCSTTARYPGFQLEVDGGGGTDVEEDRPEAREVHLLLRHPRPPRRRAWKARSPSSRSRRRATGTTRSAPAPRSSARRERADALAARPQLERRRVSRAISIVDRACRAASSPAGCATCVPRNTDGNVRRKSTRETGPTTHTSSRPSSSAASGVIIIPLA